MTPMDATHPTSYPDVNALLQELLESVQAVLTHHFIGMYLDGSLTSGDFDQDSDIDFVVATDAEISGDLYGIAGHARPHRDDRLAVGHPVGRLLPLEACAPAL